MTHSALRVVLLSISVACAAGSGTLARAQTSAEEFSADRAHGKTQDALQPPPQDVARLPSGVAILSDTMGVDFSDYMVHLRKDIQRNWEPLVPDEVRAPMMKKGAVRIIFTILPDGTIGTMKLETRSGDLQLDKAAWYAITSERKFPPLPAEFHGPHLELRIGFFYNTPPPVAPLQAVTPARK